MGLLEDVQPFCGAFVAIVVLHHRRAEHLDLGLVPAGDDVEREAAAGDVIYGGRLLRRHDRMNGRHMRGGEDAGIARRGADGRRPGETLEARTVKVGGTAESLPASNWHQRLELHLLENPGQFQRVGPIDLQDAVDGGDRTTAVEVRSKRAELEFTIVENRIGLAALRLRRPR